MRAPVRPPPTASPGSAAPAAPPGRAARRRRTLALVVVAAALLLGTWRGTDDAFPFGPFSMYAGGGPRSGVVDSTTLQAVTAGGQRVAVPDAVSGMRRAELEGRLPQFLDRPALLADVAAAQARSRPAEPPYLQVMVVRRRFEVRDRRVVGHDDVVLASWSAAR